MDIDISVPARLQLVPVHEKFPVQLLIQFIEDQTSLGRYQSAVRIGIALVPDVADGLALRIYVVHHMHKIFFVVPVVPVTLCHCWIHLLQRPLRDVVHVLDIDPLFSQRLCTLLREPADILCLFIGKFVKDSGCRLVDCIHDLLHIKILPGSVLLDYVQLAFPLLYVVYLLLRYSKC